MIPVVIWYEYHTYTIPVTIWYEYHTSVFVVQYDDLTGPLGWAWLVHACDYCIGILCLDG